MDYLERAEDMEGQARVLLERANLSDREMIAEAANYIICARFLRALPDPPQA